MFVVDTAVLLPHPPHAVARVVGRLPLLARWCAGLRRVRHLSPGDGRAPAECRFTYTGVGLRLGLAAHTAERTAAGSPGRSAVVHRAAGDGVTLTWTFVAEPEPAAASAHQAATRLRARTALEVDPDHPTAAVRAALSRLLARRAPSDLDRLAALVARYEAGRRAHPPARPPLAEPSRLAPPRPLA